MLFFLDLASHIVKLFFLLLLLLELVVVLIPTIILGGANIWNPKLVEDKPSRDTEVKVEYFMIISFCL